MKEKKKKEKELKPVKLSENSWSIPISFIAKDPNLNLSAEDVIKRAEESGDYIDLTKKKKRKKNG
jgi:hypothetical protein